MMGHHGSKENDASSSGHFQKQKSSSGLGGSKRKRDKKSLSSAVSVSSNDSSLIPAFVIESENDGKPCLNFQDIRLQFSLNLQTKSS